jgi:Transcriptional regulator, AbiEi antitoxin
VADAIDKTIAALARGNRGYVTRRQLRDLGLGVEAIRYRVKIGRLIPVYNGVYAVGHLPTLPQDRAFGALLACGPRAVLSHGSAASLWGIFRSWDTPFEVTVRSARRRRGIRIHRAALTRADITVQLGIRVTSPARMLLEITPRIRDKTLTRGVNNLRHERYLTLEQLADVLERYPRHPGAARLRPFVETPRGPTRSDFEDRLIPFCDRFGLPEPQINVFVAGREVDAFFPVERVIVELDGYEFHSSKDSFRSDRKNDAEALAADLVTVRITEDRLEHAPEREAERLHRILEGRRGRGV